jgi:hemerythrin-like domain-containing protein
MKRHNIFSLVHKGLRAMLYETALQFQRTDFINNEEAELMQDHIKSVIDLLDQHAHSEDQFIFAGVQPYEPAILEALKQEHVKDHALGENLANLLTTLSNALSDDDKLRIGKLLCQAFIELMIFKLGHMATEEDIINKLLWCNYSDEQLKSITRNMLANIPQVQITQFTKWMMKGLSNNEIAGWLRDVKNTAPDHEFQSLMRMAEQELNAHRLQLVQESITEGAMVA